MKGRGALGPCLAAAAMLLGCQGEVPGGPGAAGPVTPLELHREATEPGAHIVRREYRIREGDVLEVAYRVGQVEDRVYRIKVRDLLDVRFPFHPKLNQRERVQSDGFVYLDLIGRVKVLAQTIEQVRQTLQGKYEKYLKSPMLTVSLLESDVEVRELRRAIAAGPGDHDRLAAVAPGGRISLPLIAALPAAGKTVQELHRDLNAAYAAAGLEDLEVTVSVHSVAPLRVHVLGAVRLPGPLPGRAGPMAPGTGEMTLLQALARAGGSIPDRADLSKVMLVRRRDLPRPSVAIVNCLRLLENRKRARAGPVSPDMAKHKYDIWLADGDIVYVPTREIARRADYVDLVWNRIIRDVPGCTGAGDDTPGGAAGRIEAGP